MSLNCCMSFLTQEVQALPGRVTLTVFSCSCLWEDVGWRHLWRTESIWFTTDEQIESRGPQVQYLNKQRYRLVLVLLLTSLQSWANFSTSLSFTFFNFEIRIMLVLANVSSQRPLKSLPFLVELAGFITHCSKEEQSPWKTIWYLIKRMLERTYRTWACVG